MFIKLDTHEYPISYAQLRSRHPESSLPAFMAAEDLAHLGYSEITLMEPPTHDSVMQDVRELAPLRTNGVWTQQWEVYALDPQVIETKRKAAVPISVSPRQIRQALTHVALRASVEDAVSAGDQDLKDWWEFSTQFERVNPKVTEMGAALNVTELQLDELWTLAGSL